MTLNVAGPHPDKDIASVARRGMENVVRSFSSSLSIEPSLKRTLQQFYSSHNKELVKLLRDDKFNWGY